MDKFLQFLENHLGTIEYGWTTDDKGESLPVEIVKYSQGPFPGTSTFSTLGLNKVTLTSSVSGKHTWQELIFISYADIGDLNTAQKYFRSQPFAWCTEASEKCEIFIGGFK